MKANQKLIHRIPIHKHSIWPVALMVAAFVAAIAGRATLIQAETLTLTINTASPGHEPSRTLDGYSIETGSMMSNGTAVYPHGWRFAATNMELIQIFRNADIQSMRVGGNGVESNLPEDYDITNYFGWLEALGIPTVYSVSYTNSLKDADYYETNAAKFVYYNYGQYIDQGGNFGSGGGDVMWFAMGNEPEGYFTADNDAEFNTWLSSWNGMAEGVLAIDPVDRVWLGEMDATVNDKSNWLSKFFITESQNSWPGYSHLVAATKHFAPLGAVNGRTEFTLAIDTLTNMENGSNFFGVEANNLNSLMATYGGYGGFYGLTEFYNCTADKNTNDDSDNTFAVGLFELDALNWFAINSWYNNNGCVCMDYLATVDGFRAYSYTDANNNLYAYPLMYGQAAYGLTVADATNNYGNCLCVPVTKAFSAVGNASTNIEAYAMGHYASGSSSACTNLYVTVINKTTDTWKTNISVTLEPENLTGDNVDVTYFVSPTASCTSTNATLGGATLNGLGPFQPIWKHLGTLSGGKFTATVTNTSAAIFRIGSIF